MSDAAYLLDLDAGYRAAFRARVVARPPGGIVLDATYFYPAGGGQPADHGSLAGPDGGRWPVTDVRSQGGVIVHALGRSPGGLAPPSVGSEIEGRIDWARRYAHMRMHSAQHLVSALLFARSGLRTVAARLSAERSEIDLDGRWPSEPSWASVAAEIEAEAGRARSIRIQFVPRSEWDRAPAGRSSGLRLAPRIDPVRVLEIEGIDRCPCGGTHLRSTSEIGPIELAEPVPQGTGARVVLTLRGELAHSERVTP